MRPVTKSMVQLHSWCTLIGGRTESKSHLLNSINIRKSFNNDSMISVSTFLSTFDSVYRKLHSYPDFFAQLDSLVGIFFKDPIISLVFLILLIGFQQKLWKHNTIPMRLYFPFNIWTAIQEVFVCVCLSPVCFLALIIPWRPCPVPAAGCHPLGLCQQKLPNTDITHPHKNVYTFIIPTNQQQNMSVHIVK